MGVTREGVNNPSPTISESQLEAYIDSILEPQFGRARRPRIKKLKPTSLKYQYRAVKITAERLQ